MLGAFVLCKACANLCCRPWHLSMLLLAQYVGSLVPCTLHPCGSEGAILLSVS